MIHTDHAEAISLLGNYKIFLKKMKELENEMESNKNDEDFKNKVEEFIASTSDDLTVAVSNLLSENESERASGFHSLGFIRSNLRWFKHTHFPKTNNDET